MATLTIDARDLDRAIARLGRLRRGIPRAAGGSLPASAAIIFAASQVEVPKRSGALALSGHVGPVINEPDGSSSVMIGYGPIRYARIVHYNNHVRHYTGKAYFLIDPMHRFERLVADNAAVAVKEEIAR